MKPFHSFAAPEKNPVFAALDPSACYMIRFTLAGENLQVELLYYNSILSLYCVICFSFASDKVPFHTIAAQIDAMLDSFFTEHAPLAVSGIQALDFDETLRSRLMRHLTDRCHQNELPLLLLPSSAMPA